MRGAHSLVPNSIPERGFGSGFPSNKFSFEAIAISLSREKHAKADG